MEINLTDINKIAAESTEDPYKDYGYNLVAILNEEGMQEKNTAFQDFTENMQVETLTLEETEYLMKTVFKALYEEFELLIDFYEEEEIPTRCLSRTLELAASALENASTDSEKTASALHSLL